MAFWSKNGERLLTPEIVSPISNALSSVPHKIEWSIYDDGEQVVFTGDHAKIHIWANSRDRHGTASIMRPQTDRFELSNNVILLERLLDYNDVSWQDFEHCFNDQNKVMILYGMAVAEYAIPYFLGTADFELLTAFNRGFCCAYNGHYDGRFS